MRALVLCLSLLTASTVAASDLRCGTHLITEGADQYEVLSKCGQPVYKQSIRVPVLALSGQRAVVYEPGQPERVVDIQEQEPRYQEIERWTYNPGSGSFLRYLDFDQGRLVRITLGSRSD